MADVKLEALARRMRAARPKTLDSDRATEISVGRWKACVSAVADALEESDPAFERGWFIEACSGDPWIG